MLQHDDVMPLLIACHFTSHDRVDIAHADGRKLQRHVVAHNKLELICFVRLCTHSLHRRLDWILEVGDNRYRQVDERCSEAAKKSERPQETNLHIAMVLVNLPMTYPCAHLRGAHARQRHGVGVDEELVENTHTSLFLVVVRLNIRQIVF